MNIKQKRERFRRILAGGNCILPASVFDPISSRIASSLGFEIGMLAGSIASAAVLGAPDLVLLTLTELTEQVRRITRASDLSLLVDADHGYGNALNAMRTVEELEAASVSAITLEDTVLPKPFRQEEGQEMLSTEAMIGTLKSALAARKDPSLVIIGRTSALVRGGRESAVERVQAYTQAGVDAIFLTGVTALDDLQAIHHATDLPLLLGGTPPELNDVNLLAANGVRIALVGHFSFRAAVKAIHDTLQHLINGESLVALEEKVASQELMALATKQQEYERWQQEYLR